MFKPKQQDSDKHNEILKNLVATSVQNPAEYNNFIYGYNQTKKLLIITVWHNYVLAYNDSFDKFVLFTLHDDHENGNWQLGERIFFTKDEIVSFKKNITAKHVLELKNGNTYKFVLAPYIPNSLGSFLMPIIQEEKVTSILNKIKALA